MSESNRSLKRKRYTEPKEDLPKRLQGKLFHSVKEVRQAARKAKAFDTQKLVKKLKGLRLKDTQDPSIVDLESQLLVLKELDVELIGTAALRTKLNKDRVVSTNEHAQTAISSVLVANPSSPPVVGSPAFKVYNRISSSKVLAAEITAVVKSLKAIIQPELKTSAIGNEQVNESEDMLSVRNEQIDANDGANERPRKAMKPTSASHGRNTTSPHDEEEDDDAGWESGSVGEPVDDAGWESGTVDGSAAMVGAAGVATSDSEDSEDEAVVDVPSRTKATKKPSKSVTTESTFLPSLSVGFVRGDTDSDFSDSEAKEVDGPDKKNRRGQRARRAIWEKKFGKNANHVKKQREYANSRGGSKAGRGRGATRSQTQPVIAADSRPPRGPVHGGSHTMPNRGGLQGSSTRATFGPGRGPISSQPRLPHSYEASARHTPDERPLHPSWEAKLRQKEKQHAGILPSAGTKIKF